MPSPYAKKLILEDTPDALLAGPVRVDAEDWRMHVSEETADRLYFHFKFTVTASHRIKRCSRCGTHYIGHWHSVHCSDECATANRQEYRARHKREKRKQRQEQLKRAPEFRYRTADTPCAHCGCTFDAQRKSAKYCGDACKQAAYRKRVSQA